MRFSEFLQIAEGKLHKLLNIVVLLFFFLIILSLCKNAHFIKNQVIVVEEQRNVFELTNAKTNRSLN